MTAARNRLPNRRQAETFNYEHAGLSYVCTYGRFADGRVSEVFLNNHKSGSQADANARDAAVAASKCFQYGCSLDELRGALLRDSQGRPSTPLCAALDLIAGGSAP